MQAIIIGSTGGIGSALSSALAERGASVRQLSRSATPSVDLTDPGSIARAATELSPDGPFDLIFLATGLLHDKALEPEKSMRAIRAETLDRYFQVNAIGPALVMRHFLPLLRPDRRAVMAALSARVGSIADNRLGGWVGYRASKAALNQIIRTLAIELGRTRPEAILVGLHPGTVDTGLSKPFQRNLRDGQLISPQQSARALLSVLDGLRPGDSGRCFDWRGKEIPG
ncbi:SDR family NAD(P)-dependent oxidoreductase [Sphingomonas xanthus]|uniref:SDR family NAD(P)-dependent oxidoreductase n=1 Tax=Sphingomonas xanthus TaxID=2594473 RepID=UPI00319D9583